MVIAGTKNLVRDAGIMGGLPTVRGTRFPVSMVVTYCTMDEFTPRSLVKAWGYPEDYVERFEEALAWGQANPEEIDVR